MKETFEECAGFSIHDDCDMAVRMLAAANQVYALYVYNDWVRRQCFPQTADGEHLDYHAEMRGLTRRAATCAKGILRFLIPEALEIDRTIPAGTVCMNAEGKGFVTVKETVIPAGALYGDAEAEAEEAGSGGNAASGTIVYMTLPPVGVSACTNPGRFTGGEDPETDESLRERLLMSFRKLPNGANTAYYETLALEHEAVAAVRVLPKVRGLGTVDVVVSSQSGMPSEDLLEELRTKFNEKREICVSVEVFAPEEKTVDISAAVKIGDGYTFEEVAAAVTNAVEAYFDGSLLGCDILKVKLGDLLYQIPGVENYVLTAPAEDRTFTQRELPVLGTLTINAWS